MQKILTQCLPNRLSVELWQRKASWF